MIKSTIPTQSSFYKTTLFLALLFWPLSAQPQTIDRVKDVKVAAEACASYLATGKFPTRDLERAGFSRITSRIMKREMIYMKQENVGLAPRIKVKAGQTKKGSYCFAALSYLLIGKYGYSTKIGTSALNDAFLTALVAKGYKWTVTKVEKGLFKGQERGSFVKGSSEYVFIPSVTHKGDFDFSPYSAGFVTARPNLP